MDIPLGQSEAEINVLRYIYLNEPVNSAFLPDKETLQILEQKGYVEKIHQEIANIDRYRLTLAGRDVFIRATKTNF